MLIRVVVGIDSEPLREALLAHLGDPDVHVVVAGTRDEARAGLKSHSYDMLLYEVVEGVDDVDELVAGLRTLPDRPQLVALSRSDEAEVGARLLAAGAMAVLDAGLPPDLLGPAVAGVVEQRREERRRQLSTRPRAADPPELMCASPRAQAVVDTARRVALADSTVLILGETGVGKERIAELIHRSSTRSAGPFVTVNCAAIPTELFESELFGHEKGAFTGAHRARRGLFELAHEGTLFLDEVGEVPVQLQPKLLRALQERRIRPVGGNDAVEVDVRVVAATNRDLATQMTAGTFRRDLYYRLAVVELAIPPLRERPEDVAAMAPAFVDRFGAQLGRHVVGFEPDALDAMRRYQWPGNVRELINVVERAVLLCEGERIGLADLPPAVAACSTLEGPTLDPVDAEGPDRTRDLERIVRMPPSWADQTWKIVREGILLAGERAYLTAILTQTRGRVGEAAKRAGLSNRALFEKMRRHGLRKETFRCDPDD